MIWEAIQRAELGKHSLDVVWLDLAKAYSSIQHQLIQQALRMYHIPWDIQLILEDYFNGFKMRFSNERYTTDWINLDVDIAISCTISPILFVLTMKFILRAAEGSTSLADLCGRCYMPPLKALMADTTILCSKKNETCKMLG
ncbi:reverse transcriptase [Plakobranchus ocellatus]|uniref:Reverse transcriptase n=1 Tax=Plakobranchus ocellatus TaxID=259542 RepID=A0AAV4BZ28_9GAST|nr:reverse transcriptase [Plakobranchus ocellatus]